MRLIFAAFVAAFAASCVATPDTSNHPDSGIDCSTLSPDAGGLNPGVPNGSGTLTGSFSFTAGAAYETRDTTMSLPYHFPDGGLAPTVTGSYLSIMVYGAPIVCGVEYDGGSYPSMWILVSEPSGNYPVGDYPVMADGGGWADVLIATPLADGGYRGGHARSGTVHLGSEQACSLSGSFDVQLALYDGDAGTATGTFAAPYCR